MSSDPQHLCEKPNKVMWSYNPSPREAENGISRTCWPHSEVNWRAPGSVWDPVLGNNMQSRGERHLKTLHAHTHMCTPHTHTGTHGSHHIFYPAMLFSFSYDISHLSVWTHVNVLPLQCVSIIPQLMQHSSLNVFLHIELFSVCKVIIIPQWTSPHRSSCTAELCRLNSQMRMVRRYGRS